MSLKVRDLFQVLNGDLCNYISKFLIMKPHPLHCIFKSVFRKLINDEKDIIAVYDVWYPQTYEYGIQNNCKAILHVINEQNYYIKKNRFERKYHVSIILSDFSFKSGRYYGQHIEDVYVIDPDYITWVLNGEDGVLKDVVIKYNKYKLKKKRNKQ